MPYSAGSPRLSCSVRHPDFDPIDQPRPCRRTVVGLGRSAVNGERHGEAGNTNLIATCLK